MFKFDALIFFQEIINRIIRLALAHRLLNIENALKLLYRYVSIGTRPKTSHLTTETPIVQT